MTIDPPPTDAGIRRFAEVAYRVQQRLDAEDDLAEADEA